VAGNCALLGYYGGNNGNLLPTFQYNLSVKSLGNFFDYWTLRIWPIGCPETSVINCTTRWVTTHKTHFLGISRRMPEITSEKCSCLCLRRTCVWSWFWYAVCHLYTGLTDLCGMEFIQISLRFEYVNRLVECDAIFFVDPTYRCFRETCFSHYNGEVLWKQAVLRNVTSTPCHIIWDN
jgi:hypothetical protein